jgi:hypothetical protein
MKAPAHAGSRGILPPPWLVTSLLQFFSVSSSLETAAPFPQRWRLLRKGRRVFRREDCFEVLPSSELFRHTNFPAEAVPL